ncbi:sulfotransferase family protein [Nocardioides sp. R1-1]|uniref:sulfotransferase family protein n=1 Tax=Nocardioides sp. R1-1 TaxID=3383502 RepID=UPI0038D2100A
MLLTPLAHGRVSMQCDLCIPPVLTIATPAWLRRTGWTLAADGGPVDACPNCTARVAPRHRVRRRDAVPQQPDPARLPNVVVVGATKAGTTSMHNYLAVHPEVAASEEKEMRFFTDPDCRDWVGAYQDRFATGTRYRLESTPFYSKAPCYPGVPERMAELVPDARIIYLVRDPVERIIAEHVEMVAWNAAERPLEEELADPDEPTSPLVASSRYATQVEAYRERFGPDRVLVVDLADLGADVDGTMGRVFEFLGLDRPAIGADEWGRYNTLEEKRALPPWLMALRRGPLVRAVRRLPAAGRLVHLAWRRTGERIERPQLSPATEAALRASLQPEVDRLRALTGQAFATWSL